MSEDRNDFWVDLQWHGDPEPEPSPTPGPTPEPEPKPEDSSLTKADIEKMIQSETDRVRREYSDKLKASETEKEELLKEKMSEKERATFELEQREKAIAERDATIATRELALEKTQVLAELNIPGKFSNRINGSNREEMDADAKSFMADVNELVQDGIEKKLVSSSDPPVVGDKVPPVNRGQLDNMAEWQKIFDMPAGPEKDKAEADLIAAAENLKE